MFVSNGRGTPIGSSRLFILGGNSMTILDKLFNLNLDLENLMLDMQQHVSEYNYVCLPVNALPFASMGVDGVHYCIVPKNEDETLENSPVYRISPTDFSEGTVMWTAKNVNEFFSITITLKNAWALPILVHECSRSKDDFMEYLKDIEFEHKRKTHRERVDIEKELRLLKQEFHTTTISNVYSHIIGSYTDKNNHADIRFLDTGIKEMSLGHYAYG